MTVLAPASRRTLRVTRVDPILDTRWDRFVLSHPQGMCFHRSAWARVLIEAYGYEPYFLALEDEAGSIVAGWPSMVVASRITGRRLVTMPFSDHCRPLISCEDEGRMLLDAFIGDLEEVGASRIEVRGWPLDLDSPGNLIASRGYVRHTIDLSPGPDAIFKAARANARRGVRRAEKHRLFARLADSPSDMDGFWTLNLSVRRRHGMLPQPRAFFDAIYRHVIEPGFGYILFAELRHRPLAAVLCLRHNDVTLDKYAVNDSTAWEHRASHFVMWKSIEMEAKRGGLWYDMGRSDAMAENLHWYKEQWGAVATEAPYFYYPKTGGQGTEDPKGARKRALDLFSRVAPDPAFEAAGRLIYRHLG